MDLKHGIATVRRYDQRNMSHKNSACAALISNVSQKDRAKDVEQFGRHPEDVHKRDEQV